MRKNRFISLTIRCRFLSLVLYFTFFSNFFILSQSVNFLSNSSFEINSADEKLTFDSSKSIEMQNDVWIGLNSSSIICNCNYSFSDWQKYKGTNTRNCIKEAFQKGKHKSFAQLSFSSYFSNDKTNKYAFWKEASYISQKLNKTLEHGELYKVSYSIYVPKRYNENSDKLKDFMGFCLSNKKIPDRISNVRMIEAPFIPVDTFEYDKWVKIVKYIRPLCDINHITFGVFSNNWGNWYFDRKTIYFIDDISIKKVEISAKLMPFQNFQCYINKKYTADNLNSIVYFDSNKDYFNNIDTIKVRKLVKRAIKEKVIINISGHTDDTGNENFELSKRRAENVSTFLQGYFDINPIHFDINAYADSFPNNNNIENRQKNRRVEINLTDFSISQKVYTNILKKINLNNLEVFSEINKWLYLAHPEKHILLLFDPRFEIVHQNPKWKEIIDKVKKYYKKFKKPNLAFVLDSLTAEDQFYRTLKYSIKNLTFIKDMNLNLQIENSFDNIQSSIVSEHDAENLTKIIPILDVIYWPKISEVGLRASKSAYYIIDHTSNLELIKQHLPRLKKACIEGEAEWVNYANMFDRKQKIQNLPQKYGTQYVIEGENVEYYKYDDFGKINQDREKIGLKRLSKQIGFRLK